MKTPEQIAFENFPQIMTEGNNAILTITARHLQKMLHEAIEADRAQRDIYELIAEQLDDRVDIDGDGLEWGQRAKRAATRLRSGACDAVWGELLKSLLDHVELELS